jgi:hypothetical protein
VFNATRASELLVGLRAVNVLDVVEPLVGRLEITVESVVTAPRCPNCGERAWVKDRPVVERDGTPLPDGLHFHDLRHTANGFASNVASLKELMARMGHSTTRAALIYSTRSETVSERSRRPCLRRLRPNWPGSGPADDLPPTRLGACWARRPLG